MNFKGVAALAAVHHPAPMQLQIIRKKAK